MTNWIALLRGINVGGNKKLPMADLRALADRLWPDIPSQTYIASGNLIFHADGSAKALADQLAQEIEAVFGFEVPVLVIQADDFAKMVVDCPFDVAEPKHVHGYFTFAPPQIDQELLDTLKTDSDHLIVTNNILWLHTAQGFSKSKLAERMIRVAGVSLTARNLNSCRRLVEMLDG